MRQLAQQQVTPLDGIGFRRVMSLERRADRARDRILRLDGLAEPQGTAGKSQQRLGHEVVVEYGAVSPARGLDIALRQAGCRVAQQGAIDAARKYMSVLRHRVVRGRSQWAKR